MKQRTVLPGLTLLAAMTLVSGGCGSTPESDEPRPKGEAGQARPQAPVDSSEGAWLDNGEVRVQVVPRLGRVMDFQRPGGANALWTAEPDGSKGGWANWGGDKAWWWPQKQWGDVRGEPGKGWPPPVTIDGTPWTPVDAGPGRFAMRSPVDDGLGAYLERTFELVDGRAAMVSTTSLVPVPGVGLADAQGRLPAEFVPWVVTQVAVDGPIYARLAEGVTTGQAWLSSMSRVATPLRLIDDRWVEIDRMDQGGGRKIGLEADVLAVRLADGAWLVQRYLGSETGGVFEPAERAQVYQDKRYVELEFIGPSDGGSGERSFALEWRLQERAPFPLE